MIRNKHMIGTLCSNNNVYSNLQRGYNDVHIHVYDNGGNGILNNLIPYNNYMPCNVPPVCNYNKGLLIQKKSNIIDVSSVPITLTNEYKEIDEFCTTLKVFVKNPSLLFNINLNYLVSPNPDTYLELELYYENTYSKERETIAKAKLGSCNSIFFEGNYSYSNIIDVTCDKDDVIVFKLKARHTGDADENEVKILLDKLGTNVSIIELLNNSSI